MLYPPSLPPAVLARAFHASNGEIGVLPSDADTFLDTCKRDVVVVLGWELWLADHEWDFGTAAPKPAPGRWCGVIPVLNSPTPAIVHGSGDREMTRDQLAKAGLNTLVEPRWREHLRINFTIDG